MSAMSSLNKKSVSYDFKFYELPGVKDMFEFVTPDGYEKVTKNGITTYVEKEKGLQIKSFKGERESIAVKCEFDCNIQEWMPNLVHAYNKTTLK